MRWRALVAVALIAFAAALAGVALGRMLLPAAPAPRDDLHEIVHRRLDLSDDQQATIAGLEQSYHRRRAMLEAAMRAQNGVLAEAIQREHGNGPAVLGAVDRSHRIMGDLQKETIAHVFAMRRVLRPDQAARYDQLVSQTLTTGLR
ncbi:periplasmic heavy metal sensor [Sphingomonas sp. AP4-R1]|uniref:periplasmic heavy metal sensor n=1 Tax=Sphingomonas sp. AP4-R1 TaxID=2735134 RepID=UPI001493894B|nr:periplasmic heavy metal sensor [Sphingomonas sp. AP4-R1]QJU58563.1 periplasmic heavy metal sensor [Sphingomonas sp. AP4-R1]